MKHRGKFILMIAISLLMLIVTAPENTKAEAPDRDTRSWDDPGGSGLTITFSTPETYYSCNPASDRIYTQGVPNDWSLKGLINIYWAIPGGWELVPNGAYVVDQKGNLDLTLYYPPASAWPDVDSSDGWYLGELHVDLGIVVRDEKGQVVRWVGEEGTLGPGQDWNVFCNGEPPQKPPKPKISIVKSTNGFDANDPNGPGVPEIAPNQPVEWTYDVENIGPVDIAKIYVSVTDNVPGVEPVFDSVKSGDGDDLLEPGEIWTYKASGTALELETSTLPNLVPDACRQGDANAPGRTAYTNLGTVSVPGAEDDTDPSGYCNPPPPGQFTLGDRVWYDQDQDGIQDPNEPGYNGATVALYDNATCSGDPIASTTTGATGPAGFYEFTGLTAGDYCVQFGNIPAGWSISPADQGDGTNDSSANGSAQIPNISLSADDPNEDMGIYVPGTLGDDVRCLTTGDPLANITVSLFADFDGDGVADGPAIATTETDTTGFYQFSGLEVALAGDPNNTTNYIVRVDVNDADLGTCDVPVPPTSYNPPLDSDNPDDPTNDFLFEEPAQPRFTLGDRVWYDQDQDGIQDPNEPGYNGATVALYDNATCSGDPIASTTTGATGPAGFYEFTGLTAGDYCVQFGNIPAGWSISPADQGDGTNDSSANGSAQIPNISLSADDPNEDMGIYVPGTLGDDVRCLTTGDPLANITVSLFADFDGDGVADGPAIATTETDTTGFYQFSGLEVALAGDPNNTTNYIVRVDVNDADLGTCDVPVPPTSYNPPLDSDNPDDPTNDFLFEEPMRYTLGDRVWYDQDQDGIQDGNEPDYPGGLNVALYEGATCTGSPTATTTSDGTGFYEFTNLPAGIYSVGFSGIPSGWSISPQNQGGDDALDSDANAAGCIENISLSADDPNEDMGIYVPGTLGDDVRCLTTGDPLANITVSLFADFDGDGVADGPAIATTETDTTGFYQFSGLEVALAGDPNNTTNYIVRVDVNDADLGTCDVPVPPTSYNPPLDSDNPNDPNNDFQFQEELVCALVIDKTCAVLQPPTTAWDCGDAKPIDQLWMIWNGTQPARIRAWKGDVGSTLLATIDNIQPGDKVTVSGYAGSPNDVIWEVFAAGTNTKLGESKFHLSCSDSNMNGPEDCGLAQGNGKSDDASLLNLWLLEGMAGSGQFFLCTPEPAAPQQACTVTGVPIPSCQVLKDTGQKLTGITFQYTGGGCGDSDNTQDPSKATCSGSINPALAVNVASSNGYSIVPTTVSPDGEFTVSTSSFDSNSVFTLSNAGGTETNQIHTSCSQPLAVGDVFGSLTVTAINGDDGGADVTYFYEVMNTGDALTQVTVTDNILGSIAGPFNLAENETQVFQTTANIFETTTNTASAFGLLPGFGICPVPAASDSVTVTVEEPCDVCKGGTVELTFEYQGVSAANVVIYDDSSIKPDKILFQGFVQPGEQITITPRPGQDKLNNDISIYVNSVFNTKVHTSCSQPIGPNAVFGDFLVVDARSKDNGLMCPLNACAPQAAGSLVYDKEKLKWQVTNAGDLGLEIDRVTISWPTAFGNLKEMKADGTFFKGELPPPSAVVDSGWAGNIDDRTVKPGDTKNFEFKFANKVSSSGNVDITVDFTAGCSITISE